MTESAGILAAITVGLPAAGAALDTLPRSPRQAGMANVAIAVVTAAVALALAAMALTRGGEPALQHGWVYLDGASGVQLNANVDQYKIVGSRETPQIEVHLIEQLGGQSSTDARGIAEPANVATAAAIANAFFNATGKRILALPLTPANVLAALRSDE